MARYALAALPGTVYWALFLARPLPPVWPSEVLAWIAVAAVMAAPVVACYVLGSSGPRWVRWSVAAVDLSALVGVIILLQPVAQSSH
jgi:hypothetical protein